MAVETLARRIPVTRGQLMLLFVALNEAVLALEILLAHGLNGTIRTDEWIPIVFGPVAALVLVIAGLISLRQRTAAILLALLVFIISLFIGLLGAFFHVQRAIPPVGLVRPSYAIDLFVFAPPVLGPLTFALVAIVGVIAAVIEDPPDSGRMVIPGVLSWQVPFSKTRQYYVWVSLGILATLISSVLDHGRFNFDNPWTWLPIIIGVFATVTCLGMGLIEKPSESDLATFVFTMFALIFVGVVGLILHFSAGLTSGGAVVPERFLRGAPVLAPLLFANMSVFGLLILWPVRE